MNASTRTLAIATLALTAQFAVGEVVLERDPGKPAPAINVPPPSGADEASASSATLQRLLFTNRDQLQGTLVTIHPPQIEWKNPFASQPIAFQLTGISQILFPKTTSLPSGKFLIKTTGGDELPGDNVRFDGKHIEIETRYAGTLKIEKDYTVSITPTNSEGVLVYDGPKDQEGWKTGQSGEGGWKFKDGGFTASRSGPLSRDFKLPDSARIEFDLAWRGPLQMMIAFYSDNLDGIGGNCYALQFSNSYTYLQRMTRNNSNSLGQTELRNLGFKNKAHLGLLVSKPARTIILTIDGKQVHQWTDSADFAGKGGGIVFYSQGRSVVRLSGLQISQWDGKTALETPEKSAEDMISMVNGDKVSGEIEKISGGKLAVKSTYATLSIPIERVASLAFASTKSKKPNLPKDTAEAQLNPNGKALFQLIAWDKEGVVCESPVFGKATFKQDVFRSLKLNRDKNPSAGDPDADLTSDAPGGAQFTDEGGDQ